MSQQATQATSPQTNAASPTAPLPTAAINFRNSPGSEVNDSKIRSDIPAVSGEGGDTKVNRLDYQQTLPQPSPPQKVPEQSEPPDNGVPMASKPKELGATSAISLHGALTGVKMVNNTTYGCGTAVNIDSAPGTVIENSNHNIMPAEACVFYYGALGLQGPCYNRSKPDSPGHESDHELNNKLANWEAGVATFWKDENLKKWNDKFGRYDASKMSVDQMCNDVDSESDKMSFFRLIYYGFEHYPLPNGARP
jgi:hypothetical protein